MGLSLSIVGALVDTDYAILAVRALPADCVFLIAADNNRSNAIDVLVDAGANIESQDVHQWTPLHCAAR